MADIWTFPKPFDTESLIWKVFYKYLLDKQKCIHKFPLMVPLLSRCSLLLIWLASVSENTFWLCSLILRLFDYSSQSLAFRCLLIHLLGRSREFKCAKWEYLQTAFRAQVWVNTVLHSAPRYLPEMTISSTVTF